MKPRKISVAAPTEDRMFFTILRWYLIGSLGLLIILIVLEWLIR